MMHAAYLLCLVAVIGCLLLADFRLRLAIFDDWRRAAKTLGTAVGFFLVWDVLGVALGIFSPGSSPHTLGIMVLPRVPVEEIFFLFLFTYVTLIVWRIYARLYRA